MFGKKNTTYDPSKDLKNQPVPEGSHLLEVDDLKMYCRISYHTFFADFFTSGLELRFDQTDDLSVFRQKISYRKKYFCQ